MLFLKRFWEPLAAGEITLSFRRWKAAQVVAGRRYRIPVGIIEVERVDLVEPFDIPNEDALRAGHASAAALLADLPDRPGMLLFRIQFHLVDEPDPRLELANKNRLTAEDVAEITRRLDRLDRAAPHGPWTRQVLAAIEANPGRRAPDLATMFGRDTQPFKTDVRKLKNLGLTLSLRTGYQVSPGGRAYLRS